MKNDSSSSPAPVPSPPLTPSRDIAGRIWKILIGLLFIGAGFIFTQYLWSAYQRAAKMDAWVEVPCRIETLTVDDSKLNQHGMPKYVFQVTYRYMFDGKDYTGNRLKRLPTEVSDPRKLKNHIETYTAGTKTVCHVDPVAPESSVLKKDSKGALYSIWFPCLFIVGGAGMVLSALFRKSP